MAISDYADGPEQHSEGIRIEREELSDGSHAFNLLYDEPAKHETPGLSLKIGCTSEEHAWALADELQHCSWIELR